MSDKPAFIITIDTEPDNQWEKKSFTECENAKYLPRFQELCERFGFKPVYLTEYNVAKDSFFIAFANEKADAGLCEIGAHLHAWSTPPFIPLTKNDCANKPFLVDYPADVMKDKLRSLMDILRSNFHETIISHRAGRWAFNTEYLKALTDCGIVIDCSVLPLHFISASSAETRDPGIRYGKFPEHAYEMSTDDFSVKGDSGVYEVPMTVLDEHPLLRRLTSTVSVRLSNRKFGITKMRPERGNLRDLMRIVERAEKAGSAYIEFMLHSSEFMPGCSLAFPDEQSVEALFVDLEALFTRVSRNFQGMTLREFVFPKERK